MDSLLTRKGQRSVITSLKVGWFLAVRDIKRSNIWSTCLISFVMTLTFLNLTVVWGILLGLVEGAIQANDKYYTGDIIISQFDDKEYIQDGAPIVQLLNTIPGIAAYSPRYLGTILVEANYKTKLKKNDRSNIASARLLGINPTAENATTGIASLITSGVFLEPGDTDSIIIGKSLLEEDPREASVLTGVDIGDTVRITVNGNEKEVVVKGFIESKINEIDLSILTTDTYARALLDRPLHGFNDVAIKRTPNGVVSAIKNTLIANDIDSKGVIETAIEARPDFLKDIQLTFNILGSVIGGIGLVVAAITIFIVIFVTAITRRKYIGILKGIGINALAIEFSYVFQSIFYALTGTVLGWIVLYTVLVPYIKRNPIDFPFSDGILLAPIPQVALRAGVLLIATIIAGFIPARIVAQKNTLDSILGR